MNEFKEYWEKINTNAFTFTKSEALTDAELDFARSIISEKTKKGWASSKIIKELQDSIAKLSEKYRAERVYWTEVKKEDTEVVAEAGGALDVEKYRVILSPHPCEICIQKTDNGKKIFTQEEADRTGYGEFVPWHPNCVTGETEVFSPDVKNLMRAHYSGEVIKISLSNSSTLSVTPNHMVLTSNGFTTANRLSKGSKVITCPFFERVVSGYPNNDQMITRVDKLFEASLESTKCSSTSVPVSPEYLHSDARFCNGDIDIVSSDGFLRSAFETSFAKHMEKFILAGGQLPEFLNSTSNLSSMLIALSLASDSVMGGFSKEEILSFSSGLVDDLQRLLDPSTLDIRLEQASTNDGSRNIEMLSDIILTLSSVIKTEDVVDIERVYFHGDVYDLSTTSTSYITNGIISSNCYCIAVPYIEQ